MTPHQAPPHDLLRLDGKVALITGSTSGLGFEMARGFAAAGAIVVLHGRDEKRAAAAAAEIPGAHAIAFDVNDTEEMLEQVSTLHSRLGRIDTLVCNAGIRDRRGVADITLDKVREVLETNFVSHFMLARHVAALMVPAKSGAMIFISSNTAKRSTPRGSTYACSKAALEALTRGLAVELGPHNIRVNAISPGFFLTEANGPLSQEPAIKQIIENRVPLRRWARPSELIGPALFLASEAGSYVSGQILSIDGGASITA